MKRALLVLLVLLISAAFVTTVFAQAPAKPVIHKITGEVVNVDAAAKMLGVKGPKGEVKFDAATAKCSGYKAMDEVKAGDKVAVKYVEKDGKMMATQISKVVPKAATKKK
jgi:microtubule-associated protein 1